MANLTSQRDSCICNGTSCGCCVTQQQIDVSTEKVCVANKELRSQCACNVTIDAKTKKNVYNCNCITFAPNFNINNFQYLNLNDDQCLCRNSTNCTCCIAGPAPSQVAPVCKAPASLLLPQLATDQQRKMTRNREAMKHEHCAKV